MERQKRIKRVFTNHSEVLHLWAAQAQDNARSANVFFEGKSCYSYGYHYELGRLVEFNGRTIALINTRGYSVTTNKHIHSAKHAVSHMPTVLMPAGISTKKSDIRAAVLIYQDETIKELFDIFTSRKTYRDAYLSRDAYSSTNEVDTYCAYAQVARFNTLVDLLGFNDLRLDVPQDFIKLYNTQVTVLKERMAIARTERDAQLEVARKQREIDLRMDLTSWLNGGAYSYQLNCFKPQRLRLKDDKVETSGGASVEVAHALTLLRAVNTGRVRVGMHIGPYTVDKITKNMLTIGCHTIDINEARELLGGVSPKLSLVKAASNE
jgi:hypothetical protein